MEKLIKELSQKEYNKKYYEENKEEITKQKKKYREENKEEITKRNKKYYEDNKEEITKRKKKWREDNKGKIAKKNKKWREKNEEYDKKYREDNKEKIKEYKKKWRDENKKEIEKREKKWRDENKGKIAKKNKKYREDNKEEITKKNDAYVRKRRKIDPIFDMTLKIRNAIGRFWRDGKYSKSFEEMMGCNLEDFKIYISKQFVNDMSFENQGEWELDHKVPISLAKTEDELIKLNHFSNFQPLWKEENLEKRAKLLPKHKKLMFELIGR